MARKIFVLRKYDIWVIYKVPLDRACRRCLELHGEVFTFDKLPRCSCTEDNDYIGYSPFSAPLIPEMKKEAAEAIAARTRTCSRCGVEFFETEYSNESLCARCSIEAVREITRKNLSEYSPSMLRDFQAMTTSGTVICYALYTVSDHSPTPWLLITLPYVIYVILRYIYLVDQRGEGGAPDETLVRDKPILLTAVLYGFTVMAILLMNLTGWV